MLSDALLPGGIVNGAIGAAGEQDEWVFSGRAGDIVRLGMTETATQAGFDAFAELFMPGAEAGDVGERIDAFFPEGARQHALTADGTYVLRVGDHDDLDTGVYSISLEGINPISPDARPLKPGGIISGRITSPLDVRQYTFEAAEGQSIQLGLTSTASQSNFDALVELFAPSGERVDEFFREGSRRPELRETGTYMLAVHDHDYAQAGSFTIALEGLSPISPAPQKLKPGGISRGSIDAPLDMDQWTFNGRAGDSVALSATSVARQQGFDGFFELIAPSGNVVDGFFQTGGRSLQLGETGTYMLAVHDHDYAQTGRYTIALEGLSPPSPDAMNLPLGVARSRAIDSPIGIDQYLFAMKSGESARFFLSSTPTTAGFVAFAEIYSPAGERVHTFFAGESQFTARATGSFVLLLHDHDFAQAGSYSLSATRRSPRLAGISGTMFNDTDGDGRRDRGEAALPGARLFLDLNGNKRQDPDEPRSTTDADGVYAFTRLRAGSYTVRVRSAAPGFEVTAPRKRAHTANLATGKAVAGLDFAARYASGSASAFGTVFADDNRNRTLDAAEFEDVLFGWTVFDDANGNGRLDGGESSTTTDVAGRWTLAGLSAGAHTIRLVTSGAWAATAPAGGALTVNLVLGRASFGNAFALARA